MKKLITKKLIEELRPREKEFVIWDTRLPGFGVRVRPSGSITYILQARLAGGRSGRQFKASIGNLSKITLNEARSIAKKRLFEIANGSDPLIQNQRSANAPQLKDFADRYLDEHVSVKRKPGTHQLYSDLLQSVHATPLAAKPIDQIKKEDLIRLHSALRSTPVKANRTLSVLSAMYGYASDLGIVAENLNPTRGVERYKERGRETFLNQAQIAKIGEALVKAETTGIPFRRKATGQSRKHIPKNKPPRTIDREAAIAIRLLLLTGCRVGEILSLRWDQIDTERGIAALPDSKTGKKTVFLNSQAIAYIMELPRIGPFLFPGRDPRTHRVDLKRPWQIVRQIAEMPNLRLHDLRHTFASVGASQGMGLPIVAKLLGHVDTRMTEKYAHLEDGPVRHAAERIGEIVERALDRPNRTKSQSEERRPPRAANDN